MDYLPLPPPAPEPAPAPPEPPPSDPPAPAIEPLEFTVPALPLIAFPPLIVPLVVPSFIEPWVPVVVPIVPPPLCVPVVEPLFIEPWVPVVVPIVPLEAVWASAMPEHDIEKASAAAISLRDIGVSCTPPDDPAACLSQLPITKSATRCYEQNPRETLLVSAQ